MIKNFVKKHFVKKRLGESIIFFSWLVMLIVVFVSNKNPFGFGNQNYKIYCFINFLSYC